MKKNQLYFALFILVFATLLSCTKSEDTPQSINVLSATINGSNLTDGAQNVANTATIELVFSAALEPAAFESALSLNAATEIPDVELTYLSQASRVQISTELQPETTYTLRISISPIGKNGERLATIFERSFTTAADGTITSLPPCTSGSNNCLQTIALTADGTANFHFYSSFPIYEEDAAWEDLRSAIIVVHGANRNADDYFNYLMQSLQSEEVETSTVLISPFFKTAAEAEAGDYFWGSNNWREGQQSINSAKISSFEVIDQLIAQLANKDRFPVLETIIVTGHSSGALFTHLYAAANRSEASHPDLNFEYIVANSQYFYYPDGQRINENSNQLYTPTGCTGYDLWPTGFTVVPAYLNTTNETSFNEQFINRSILYLLGNGAGSDSAFNDTDCYATLLGSSRYQRGENMFRYMELMYPGQHAHSRVVVEGIGHDGAGMYQSGEFRGVLGMLLGG